MRSLAAPPPASPLSLSLSVLFVALALPACCGNKTSGSSANTDSKSSSAASKRGNWAYEAKDGFMKSQCLNQLEGSQRAKGTDKKANTEKYNSDVCYACFLTQAEQTWDSPADAMTKAAAVTALRDSCVAKTKGAP